LNQALRANPSPAGGFVGLARGLQPRAGCRLPVTLVPWLFSQSP